MTIKRVNGLIKEQFYIFLGWKMLMRRIYVVAMMIIVIGVTSCGKEESVYANIENASSPPLTSTLTVSTDSGQKWEVVFDDCTEYDGSGVAGRVFLADLNGDEQSEIIVDLGVIGSTYGSTYVRVFTIENDELVQILDLSDDNIQEFDSEVDACVGAEYQEGGYLKVTGLVPGVYAINSTRKDILIRWDGTDWINCS